MCGQRRRPPPRVWASRTGSTFLGGDFFDEVPSADVHLLKFVLHDGRHASSGTVDGSQHDGAVDRT
ncbi:methyltransferase [Streptomyces sp. NPDC091387]|uniref:methyltransferase n=1 Tax=Streptomyces sp. NPDC091387 TaxID=3365998 RepID=UPI003825CE02